MCFAAERERAVCLRDRPTRTLLCAFSKPSNMHFALRPEGRRPKRTLLAAAGSTGQCVCATVQNALCAQHPEKVRVRFEPALKRTRLPVDLPKRVFRGLSYTFPSGLCGPCDLPVRVFRARKMRLRWP